MGGIHAHSTAHWPGRFVVNMVHIQDKPLQEQVKPLAIRSVRMQDATRSAPVS